MAMTIRAEVRRSVSRGDEERCPCVAVALGLLVRPRRTGQSGRGGARGRHVTLFQRRCWFGMSASLSWPVSAARGGSDGIGMLPRAPAAAPLSRRTCPPRPTCTSPFPLLGTCSELAKLTAPLLRTTFAIQTQGSIDRYGHAGAFQLLQGHNGLPTLVPRAQYTRRGAGSPEPTHR